jgi:biotin transport system permease protein
VLGASALVADDPRVVLALLTGTLVWARWSGASLSSLARQVRAVALIIVAITLAHWALGDPRLAIVAALRIITLVLAAGVVTSTTPTADLLAVIERGLVPLRRFRVDPTRVGLTLLMTIRLVPLLADTLQQIRDAQRSRGVERPVTSALGPLVIAALRSADQLADALDARGLADAGSDA